MRVLIIDNYDSFTFNLAQCCGSLGARVDVRRNDSVTAQSIESEIPDALLISPGPGRPESAGASLAIVRHLSGKLPILGVCLGHQVIGAAFGCRVIGAPTIVHGKTARVEHDGSSLFMGVSSPFDAARYHSLIVDQKSITDSRLRPMAWTSEHLLMGIAHCEHQTFGVQFHPESILTRQGGQIIKNFLTLGRR